MPTGLRAGGPRHALHEKTLKLMKSTLDPDHPNLLNCMSNLALDYSDAGRLEDAIAPDEAALKLKRINPGPEHPDTLRTMGKLAWAYRGAGRVTDAIAFEEGQKTAQRNSIQPSARDFISRTAWVRRMLSPTVRTKRSRCLKGWSLAAEKRRPRRPRSFEPDKRPGVHLPQGRPGRGCHSAARRDARSRQGETGARQTRKRLTL